MACHMLVAVLLLLFGSSLGQNFRFLKHIYGSRNTIYGGNNVDADVQSLHAYGEIIDCPCEDHSLCLSLGKARAKNPDAPHVKKYIQKQNKTEVFAFVLSCGSDVWSKFNWAKLTTLALVGFYDSHLTCFAHSQGVKVVKLVNIPANQLSDPEARLQWVRLHSSDVAVKFMDGINIDFEAAVGAGSPEQIGLSKLAEEASVAFHKLLPGSQVSFDFAWSALGIDGRFYDYTSIAKNMDLIFIMAYDEQSQMWNGPCIARPNSGLYKTAKGVNTYLHLGIPAHKLVLGVPWYGYNYPCLVLYKNNTCTIDLVPFRGCNCSDAAGRQCPYSYMKKGLEQFHAIYRWDKYTVTPYYNYKNSSTKQFHQMRYDDERSLMYKYMFATFSNMRGVGMWTANYLDYSNTTEAQKQRDIMWGFLPD